MGDNLTPRQHRFVMSYIECGNASEAYRQHYSTENMLPATVNRAAKRLLDLSKIGARIAEIQAEDRARCAVTVDTITAELEESRLAALANCQIAAAVAATMAKAKLHGLLDADAPPAPALNLKLILGGVDEDELQRRYAETILLRQQRRKRLGYGGSGDGGELRS